IVLLAIVGVALVNVAPDLVWWVEHGQNSSVVQRGPEEAEREGLKLSQLVLPVEEHRVSALADLQETSTRRTPVRSERGQQLGIIGAIGLVALLVGVVVALRRRRSLDADADADADADVEADDGAEDDAHLPPPPSEVMATMGLLTVVAIVMA